MIHTPTLRLSNGVDMPSLGFGVFQVPNDRAATSVAQALRLGYRSIDTAAIYENEPGTGRAIAESGIPRSEVFLTTKLWNACSAASRPCSAFHSFVVRKTSLRGMPDSAIALPVPGSFS